jgi:hypothetical protein
MVYEFKIWILDELLCSNTTNASISAILKGKNGNRLNREKSVCWKLGLFPLKFLLHLPLLATFFKILLGTQMPPQVRCPNCGTSINLKNREETDFNMILEALQHRQRTFSDLLRTTRLPRKTLSIRLKQLAEKHLIIKDGGYRLNGEENCVMKKEGVLMRRFSNLDRKKLLIAMLIIGISLPTGATVLAMMHKPPEPEPIKPLGSFTVTAEVTDASDVYGWQVIVAFDNRYLKVVEVTTGDFLEDTNQTYGDITSQHGYELRSKSMFMYSVNNGMIIIAQTLLGHESGKSGSGTLASIKFEYYYTENYAVPEIVYGDNFFETGLRNIDSVPVEGQITLR